MHLPFFADLCITTGQLQVFDILLLFSMVHEATSRSILQRNFVLVLTRKHKSLLLIITTITMIWLLFLTGKVGQIEVDAIIYLPSLC